MISFRLAGVDWFHLSFKIMANLVSIHQISGWSCNWTFARFGLAAREFHFNGERQEHHGFVEGCFRIAPSLQFPKS